MKSDLNNLSLTNSSKLRYPVSRLEYSFHTGELGENVITNVIKDLLPSIEIPFHRITVNGSDIRIFYNGKLIGKFEVLNLNSKSYINSQRAKSIRENLKNVKYKGLICSFFNATSRAREILKNIPICTIGFQLLPYKFHQYYARLNKVHHRKIANNRSLKQLKNTLKSFFHRIGLDLLMYVSNSNKISINYQDILNSKNENSNIGAKNMKTEKDGVSIEEKTNGSIFKDKFRTKLKSVFGNLLFKTKMLLLNLFHDTSGRLPRTTKYKTQKWIMSGYGNRSILEYCSDRVKKSKLHPIIKTCPYKTVLICRMKYFKPKYICGFPFQDKIRYCDYCKDLLDEETMDLYGRPICKFYNERCNVILQSYEYVNSENSQICYWISGSERVKALKEFEKYRGNRYGRT